MGKRRKARILAMNVLFQAEVGRQDCELALDNVLLEVEDEEIRKFVKENVEGCWKNLEAIDKLLKNLLEKWQIERLQSVDKAVIRLAIYEMFYRPDIPARVTINEAIEIAKQFGDIESGRFVNGILAAALKLKQEVK